MNQKKKNSHSKGGKRTGSGRKKKPPTKVISFRVDETLSDEFKNKALFLLNGLKSNHMKKLLLLAVLFIGCAKDDPKTNYIELTFKGRVQPLNAKMIEYKLSVDYYDIQSIIGDTTVQIYRVGSKQIRINKYYKTTLVDFDACSTGSASMYSGLINGESDKSALGSKVKFVNFKN